MFRFCILAYVGPEGDYGGILGYASLGMLG